MAFLGLDKIGKLLKLISLLKHIRRAIEPLKVAVTKWRYKMPNGQTVEVEVKSGWASKINWAEALKVLAMIVGMFGLTLTPADQQVIAIAISSVGALITIIMRVFFTKKVTAQSAGQ